MWPCVNYRLLSIGSTDAIEQKYAAVVGDEIQSKLSLLIPMLK
jgi:hypothetical protein